MHIRRLTAVVAAITLVALGATSAPAFASGTSGNPSTACTAVSNGGVSHGGCTSTAAKFGSADLESLPYLSTAALQSNCSGLKPFFEQMATQIPLPITIGDQTFTDSMSLGDYVFHDIFGPDMSTCIAILAADHATIANPGPDGPYDVYYTGGHGGNTTYLPGVPEDIAFLFVS